VPKAFQKALQPREGDQMREARPQAASPRPLQGAPQIVAPLSQAAMLREALRTSGVGWGPKDLVAAVQKLEQVRVRTPTALAELLAGEGDLNRRLTEAGLKALGKSTMAALRARFTEEDIRPYLRKTVQRSLPAEAAPGEDVAAPLQEKEDEQEQRGDVGRPAVEEDKDDQPEYQAQDDEQEGEWVVEHARMVMRAEPSTCAKALGTARRGRVVRGRKVEVEGGSWVRMPAEDFEQELLLPEIVDGVVWMLIDGQHLGLGRLLKRVAPGSFQQAATKYSDGKKKQREAWKKGFLYSPRAHQTKAWSQGEIQEYTFDVEDQKWPEYLKLHGFCVLRDVIPAQEFKQIEDTFWREIAHVVPGLKRGNPSTWRFPRSNGPARTGIVRSWGLPHSDFVWAIRLHPRIKYIFETIFGTPELVVSMDSVKLDACDMSSAGPPWLHRDQLQDVEAYSVQSIFAFYEVGPENAGTILVPDSHLEAYPWDEEQNDVSLLRAHGRQRNSVKVPKSLQHDFMAHAIKPRVPDNGIILFSSRTIHASAPSSVIRWEDELKKLRPPPSLPRPNRVGVSVCMCPRSRRSNACRSRKLRVFRNQGSTAHWPDDELHWPDEWTGSAGNDMNEVWDRWAEQGKPPNLEDTPSETGFRHLPKPDMKLTERSEMM